MMGRFTAFTSLGFLFVSFIKGLTAGRRGLTHPESWQNAVSVLTQDVKMQFLDAHNYVRSNVWPTAANMEYMEWDDDVANLAQMWSDQCEWKRGFLQFGHWYPNPPSPDRVGQNLARELGRWNGDKTEKGPADSVKRWFKEKRYYTFGKVDNIVPGNRCSRLPCAHYTQLVWATSNKVGCGLQWCNKNFGTHHYPSIPGETIITCDYIKAGNVHGEVPYKIGESCSLCPAGKDWCYNNLCRECKDSSIQCGTKLTKSMCSTNKDLMMKRCPKLCGFCGPDQGIGAGGETAMAPSSSKVIYEGWCKNKYPNHLCERWATKGECQKKPFWMQNNCQKSCNACCDDKYDQTKCQMWAMRGECEKNNKTWMSQNCPRSCSHCFNTETL